MKLTEITTDAIAEMNDIDLLYLNSQAHSAWATATDDIRPTILDAYELIAEEMDYRKINRRWMSSLNDALAAWQASRLVPGPELIERYPAENASLKFAVRNHYIGKSVHSDLLLDSAEAGWLNGWTLLTSEPDALSEPVESLAQAKEIEKDGGGLKINWTTGEFSQEQIRAEIKEPETDDWLLFEGEIEKGAVGASENYPGILSLVDGGKAQYGAITDDYREYFLDGKVLKGRFVFAQVEMDTRSVRSVFGMVKTLVTRAVEKVWLFRRAKNQLHPYVLSGRAVDAGWMPPTGISALPDYIRDAIPEEDKFWLESGSNARAIRDRLVEKIKRGEVTIGE